MDPNSMRKAIAEYYGRDSKFAKRLKFMGDMQVKAIYFRMKSKGELK